MNTNHELLDLIDDVKQKLTDNEYKLIVEKLRDLTLVNNSAEEIEDLNEEVQELSEEIEDLTKKIKDCDERLKRYKDFLKSSRESAEYWKQKSSLANFSKTVSCSKV